jgi:hypothetical protein
MLYGINKISNSFDVITEVRVYHYEVFKDLDNQFIRLGLYYELSPGIFITAGYIHQYSQTQDNIDVSENRPHEEITFKNKFKKFRIAHRYRIEHQWIINLVALISNIDCAIDFGLPILYPNAFTSWQ